MKTRLNKGFTLIELLVVIAIIGILSGVVLTSLNSARSKAKDARITASMAQVRSLAEQNYDGASYGSLTGIDEFVDLSADVDSQNGSQGGGITFVRNTDNTQYVAYANLVGSTTAMWCVDSSGNSKSVNETTIVSAATVACP